MNPVRPEVSERPEVSPGAAQAVEEVASSMVGASTPLRAVGKAQAPALSEWGLAIFACAALLMVLLAVLKRYGRQLRIRGFGTQRIQILEKTSLGPGSALVVVAYQGRQLLLATGSGHTQCLRDDPIDAQTDGAGTPTDTDPAAKDKHHAP